MEALSSGDHPPNWGLAMISRRVALVVEALAGLVAATAGAILGLLPDCVGQMAPVGGQGGGIVCTNRMAGGGWLLFLFEAAALGVTALAVRALAARPRDSETLLRIGQIPVFGAAAFVLFFYRIHPEPAPIWGAIALGLCAVTVLFTSPRRRRTDESG